MVKSKNKITTWRIVAATFMMLTFVALPAFSQDKGYDDLERIQDKIEDLDVDVYQIIEKYPNATYTYVYKNGGKDGEVVDVVVTGVPDQKHKDQLKICLINLENLKDQISNQHNRFGVYYVTETLPKPKMGYDDFYDNLQRNLTYPERAEELGLEGSIYVKFIVTPDGKVENVMATERIDDTYADWVVEEMKEEAKQAVVATSGDWIPARVGGEPVFGYRVLPVQFKIKTPYYRPF